MSAISRKLENRNSQFAIRTLFSKWRNAILGTLLVLAGVVTALLTLLPRRLGEPRLAGIGAISSLVFVLLITILVVPPLAPSALSEVWRGVPLVSPPARVAFSCLPALLRCPRR